MPATYVSIGTVGTGTTTATAGLPASLATGDGVLLTVVVKPDTATINTPTDWTLVSNVAGGGGTVGNGTGPQRSATFFREKSAAWSTMPAVSVTGGTSSAAVASRWTKAGNETWDVAAATGVYGTAATTTNASTTMGSNPGITSGDMLAMFVTNQSATPTWSAQSFTATGATIGAATERSEAIEFATSPQVGGMLATAAVTAGTASANPVANATASAATRGTSTIVRLRAVAQPFHPVGDASSPATIKSTTGSSFTTASFTPPANACIVVGLTSDADSNAGTTPTITDSTAGRFTWTRVASTGHGGAGSTGLVALFAGVPTSPGTSPGAMTITVTPNNNGATKPRMIRTTVYTSTAVDITDPIGVFATGAISGSSVTSSLTPETTGGGLRMMWLDWSATGVPTTTQSGVGVADSYHNAGLSTNIQLAKITTSAAGVAETIGANLLSASTSGNWLSYELRAPVAGGIPTGTGSGAWSFSGSGTGKRVARASGTGSWSFVGSGSGKRNPRATGTGTFTFTGAGVGDAPTPPPSQGAGSGSWGFSGTGTGKRTPKASGAGTVTTVGTGTGRRVAKATGGGTLAWAATGTGKRTPKAGGTGGWNFTGTGTGRRAPKGGGTGTWTFTGSGIGNSPGVGMSEGFGVGSWSFAGTGVGKRAPKGGGTGTLLWTGSGTGKRRPVASGGGSWSLSAAAVGYREPIATGSGSLAYVGTGTGTLDTVAIPELVVGTMRPARFTAAPAIPTPVATTVAPRFVTGGPLPQRITRRT